MFRARFNETLPKSLANFGPQELERDVVDTIPGERVEQFLCALLGLLLNRKQDVKYAHSDATPQEHFLANYTNIDKSQLLGPATITAHWKRLYRRTRLSGRRTGRARTPWREGRLLVL